MDRVAAAVELGTEEFGAGNEIRTRLRRTVLCRFAKLVRRNSEWAISMQLEKTSHWLTIVGNLGLLIGVALIIVQINQNSELVRDQLFHTTWTDDMNMHLALMGDNPAAAIAKAIERPTELTVEESKVLEAYITYWSLNEARRLFMRERGMELAAEAPSTYAPGDPRFPLDMQVLGNAYAKAFLQEFGAGPVLTPKLDVLMGLLSGNENREKYQRIAALVKENE